MPLPAYRMAGSHVSLPARMYSIAWRGKLNSKTFETVKVSPARMIAGSNSLKSNHAGVCSCSHWGEVRFLGHFGFVGDDCPNDQDARVRDEAGVRSFRVGVDEIWGVLTAILDSENVIFTNRIDQEEGDDRSLSSLNLITGEFWRLRRDRIPR